MCPPALLPVMALASAAIAAGGQVMSGIAAKQQGNYENKIDQRNAVLERQAGQMDADAARQEALRKYREIAQVKGEQNVNAGGSGTSATYGTALDQQYDTSMVGREDIKNINTQALQTRQGHDRAVWNDLSAGAAAKAKGKAAFTESLFSAGSTMLGGATQYGKLKAGV